MSMFMYVPRWISRLFRIGFIPRNMEPWLVWHVDGYFPSAFPTFHTTIVHGLSIEFLLNFICVTVAHHSIPFRLLFHRCEFIVNIFLIEFSFHSINWPKVCSILIFNFCLFFFLRCIEFQLCWFMVLCRPFAAPFKVLMFPSNIWHTICGCQKVSECVNFCKM